MSTVKKKKPKQLSEEMLAALNSAKIAIRSSAPMIDGDIVDIYDIGERDDVFYQGCEVQIKGEDEPRRYAFREADTIMAIFGEPDKDKRLANITYNDDGVPESMQVPDVKSNDDGVFWYQIRKGKS